ncbi:MAG: iron-only hydrogenase system regulator [Firmicutes bacterium]|nr:iron-only hydrogenase system regulator [Candidatus Fermentithermobacillaceae bacterium]
MDRRIAIIAIIVEDRNSVARLNDILHRHGEYIIGRMGLPYEKRRLSLISVALDAPADVVNSLSGQLGMLPGVTAKTLYAKMGRSDA